MNTKQVMDIHVSKGITTAQSNEHLRQWSEKGWEHAIGKGNYDRTREPLNFEVTAGRKISPVDKSRSIPDRIQMNLESRGIKDPNQGLEEPKFRTVVNIIFGGSRDRMHELAFGDQKVDFTKGADNSGIRRMEEIEKWASDIYSFVSQKYGEENIAAFIVHLDELNPHIHCTLLPIQEGKFAYKKIFAGKDKYEFSEKMKILHNEIAEVNRKWGLDRGSNISETGARHRSTEEYRRQLNEKCTGMENEISGHKKELQKLRIETGIAERRVKGLSTMVSNLQKAKEDKEKELLEVKKMIASLGDTGELRRKARELEEEITRVESKLETKKEKLSSAGEQLRNLKQEMLDVQHQKERLKESAYRFADNIHSHADNILKDVMLEDLISDYRDSAPLLDNRSKELFNGTLLESMANQANEIMYCATLLFLGYVDKATEFAEGQGGGGSSNGLKWGKDENEDDRSWARRCMLRAHKMLQGTGHRSKR